MLLVGLTGGIASGKSLVSNYLRELGAYIIDYDIVSRAVVEPGLPAWKDVVNYFGQEILQEDQKLNRAKLGRIVFNDDSKRKKLESFIHHRLCDEVQRQEKTVIEANPEVVVVHDVPLLFETGVDKRMEKTIVVYASEENQLRRLMARDGLSKADATIRIKSQFPLAEKVKRSDFIIDNNGSMEETKRQVQELYQTLSALAREKK